MKQHNRFRLDNTEGYSPDELVRLNAAFDRIVDIEARKNSDDDLEYEAWLDIIADGVLADFG